METIMFTLGILAMVLVALITTLVVGIVRVINHSKQIKNLYSQLNDTERHLHDRINDDRRRVEQIIVDTHRDINMVEGTLRNGMDHGLKAVNDQITDSVTQSKSYTDSRIDKLIDTYFVVKEAEQNNKKLIKG